MNEHELRGTARHAGGKVEGAVGDLVDRREWQVDGVINKVAGSAEHLLGRVQSIAGDVADMAPALVDDARAAIRTAADRTAEASRVGARRAEETVRANPGTAATALAAAVGGLALGWLLFARRG